MNKKYDVTIIGAGHNGLVAAAYLARKGLDVLVLEQKDVVGGACITAELAGAKYSKASYSYGLFHPKIAEDLHLKEHGLVVLDRDPSSFTPLKDGRYLFMHHSMAKTQKEIAKFSQKDAEKLPEYERRLDRAIDFIGGLLMKTPSNYSMSNLFSKAKALLLGKDASTLIKLATYSAYGYAREFFESEPLIAVLCTDGITGTFAGPKNKGTAYVLLHHVMGTVNGKRGKWGYAQGGMGAVTQALSNVARSYGAEIRTNADVVSILVKDGTVTGVALKDGTEIRSNVVASNADPRNTFEKLLNEKELPKDFLAKIRKIDYSSASSKINLVLGDMLKFNCYDGPIPAMIHICEDTSYIQRAFEDAKSGKIPDNLVLEACMPTVVDKTLAPKGKHVLNIFAQYTPYNLAGSNWDAEKGNLLKKTIAKMAEYTNIGDIIEAAEVITPLDLERDFRLTGGNIFHGALTLNQIFDNRPVKGSANYRTPITNLYLCGSGAHPGGGVTGIPGHNAAREILKDLGIKNF